MPVAKYYWKHRDFYRHETTLRTRIRRAHGQKGGLNPLAYYRHLEKQKAWRRNNAKWAIANRAACKKWRQKVIAATGGATEHHDAMYKMIREKEKHLRRQQELEQLKRDEIELKQIWDKRRVETRGWRTRPRRLTTKLLSSSSTDKNAAYIVKFFNAQWHRDFEGKSGKKSQKKILSEKS